MKMNNAVFIGSFPEITHSIIEKHSFGLCLNLNKGYLAIKDKVINFNQSIFIDNGSFERFNLFLKGKLSELDYFNKDKGIQYFEYITFQYELLLMNHPEKRFVITIPEIIGSGNLSRELQLLFLEMYKELQLKYNCSIIIALQFNPNSKEWFSELVDGMKFIQTHISDNWIVGIPFGNDFKILQNKLNLKKLFTLKKIYLKDFKFHMFALGTIGKIKKLLQLILNRSLKDKCDHSLTVKPVSLNKISCLISVN